MYEFDEFLSETFLKKTISFSKSPIRPASSDFSIAPLGDSFRSSSTRETTQLLKIR